MLVTGALKVMTTKAACTSLFSPAQTLTNAPKTTHRLENLDGTVGKLFSQLCSFFFVEESLIHGTSSYRLPNWAGRVTAAYFLQR